MRKRHLQQDLFPRRGGKRPGAGRKAPRGRRASSPHRKRPVLKARFPVHVVLRVARDIKSMRKGKLYKAMREATLTVVRRELAFRENGSFRIVHISIQRTHVHMLVEASHETALSRGMQSFQISAAKHINRVLGRRGSVFPDRFHQEIIDNPQQMRRTLAYVLNNWRKHREDREPFAAGWKIDPFSTGVLFGGWVERNENPFVWKWREPYLPLVVYFPDTWLLEKGWKIDAEVSCFEIPSDRRR